MSRIITGHWEPDGSDIYVPVGFKPNFLMAVEYITNPLIHYWFGEEEEDAQITAGITDTAGTKTLCADGAGFATYDTGVQGPYGDVSAAAAIADWVLSTAYQARSATAHGDYVRATSTGTDDNGLLVDRSCIFECVTAGTTAATEPTWPSAPGGNSVTDNGVIWQKVTDVPTTVGGYQGFKVDNDIQTDGQEFYYMAIRSDDVIDQADVTAWPGGIKGM